ncbi:CocE/NonD family hydrolase [Chloroflexota bacterium]
MKKVPGPYGIEDSQSPPPHYDPPVLYDTDKLIQERDVMVPMRDGVRICVDIYRPDTNDKLPALLAFAGHNKDLQTPEATETFSAQPAWSAFWLGAKEAGDTRYIVSKGYVHVIANPRGVGKSEDGPPSTYDQYDTIEWMAQQSWCDGNIGMIGMSAFANSQLVAARQAPPHLKAIFPWDPGAAYSFRDAFPGGVINVFAYLLSGLPIIHQTQGRPATLPAEEEKMWEEAMNNPDYVMYSHLYNLLTQKGQLNPRFYNILVNPYDTEGSAEAIEAEFEKVKLPTYTGAGWYAYSCKHHLNGGQNWYTGIKGIPKKMLITGPASPDRPWHSSHDEILRWYDYWLKGIDTGIMDEPPVKYWLMGANEWYYADDWPLPETQWKKYYLDSWERLREVPFASSSRLDSYEQPDGFVQMPPTQTRTIQKLRYMTDPLPEDVTVVGPGALYLYAAIDQEDTNWIVTIKDVGPDSSIRTGREGERMLPTDLPEREVVRGWLKASHRALDPKRSKPWKPWHYFTRKAQKPAVPGEITEYAIEILSTANQFKKGHRICVEISSMDMPTGSAGFTNVEYFAYHICSSKMTLHKIYHSEKYPSHLLLPVIPNEASA